MQKTIPILLMVVFSAPFLRAPTSLLTNAHALIVHPFAEKNVIEITSSGYYYLPTDLKATHDESALIRILSDNVVLDLNDKSITHTGTSNAVGIEVGDNISGKRSNVIVKNGRIKGLKNAGVTVAKGSNNITLESLIVDECANIGISFIGTANDPIMNVDIKNCSCFQITKNTIAVGLLFIHAKNVHICNCNANRLGVADTRASYGFLVSACDEVQLEHCAALFNQAFTNYGFYCLNSTSIHFKQCGAKHNTGTSVAGMLASNSSNSTVTNCAFSYNTGLIQAMGAHFKQCSSNNVSHTTANTNQSAAQSCYGIAFENGISNTAEYCTTFSNTATALKGRAAGLALISEHFSTIAHCTGARSIGNNVVGSGIFIGKNCDLCTIANNTTRGNTGTFGYGIYDERSTDNPASDGSSITTSILYDNLSYANKTANYQIESKNNKGKRYKLSNLSVESHNLVPLRKIKPYTNIEITSNVEENVLLRKKEQE